uniref:TBC1 domain family member 7 n=1 Tax=Daphnia galeata TaxID=27404 RepID=A0A8J2WP61_9CRUS|nr:unnamed protein product [Daphnia galeata]
MATDERNFRSYYYEKVGFRGVEEKKSLEILLKDKPLDVIKLKQFCLRFPVPALHRNKVWKILLGVLSAYTDSHHWIWEQRQIQFSDLTHALDVMGHTTAATQPSEKLLLVWLLENRCLHFDYIMQLQRPDHLKKLAILETCLKLFDREVDAYWLAKGFFHFSTKFIQGHVKFKELLKMKLEIEDTDLYKHVIGLGAMDSLPLEYWFGQCFAGYIAETSLVRIWDKLLGGSTQIIVFLAVALILHFRHSILACKSNEEINLCVSKVTKETSEIVVNEAIELWQEHGGPIGLTITDPPKQK